MIYVGKTKAFNRCAVTAQLMCAFVFAHAKCRFLYPATVKSAGYYVIPSVKNLSLSVRLSVRPSVRQHFVSALYLEHFLIDFLQTLYKS